MTTGRINQVTTLRPKGPSRPQRGRRGKLPKGDGTSPSRQTRVKRRRSTRLAVIRHSFRFPQATPTQPRPRGSGEAGEPTQRTESDGCEASHPRRIPKLLGRFLARGHRSTRYLQVETWKHAPDDSRSQTHRGQKTQGLNHRRGRR
jgi:hypothetical protein